MICRTYDVVGGTVEQYDEVSEHMGAKPEGVHLHIAMKTDDGFRVIEVWDSAEQDDRYMESSGLGEAIQAAGIPEPVVTDFEVHNLDWIN